MMRRARPQELRTRAVPVLTAHLSEAELAQWVPVPFDLIEDPAETPEPSLGALVALDSGAYIVLYYGKDSGQLTLEIPFESDPTGIVTAFFEEIPLPVSRVLWHRSDVQLPKTINRPGRERKHRAAVLIADADAAFHQEELFRTLLSYDISPDIVDTLADALFKLDEHVYEVVILSTDFPPEALLQVMLHIRSTPSNACPVVLLLGNDLEKARGLGIEIVQIVVHKPAHAVQLAGLIRMYLGARRVELDTATSSPRLAVGHERRSR